MKVCARGGPARLALTCLGGWGDAELGINLEHIQKKTLAVLNPRRILEPDTLNDDDLAGPLLFCLAFGALLLLVRPSRVRAGSAHH